MNFVSALMCFSSKSSFFFFFVSLAEVLANLLRQSVRVNLRTFICTATQSLRGKLSLCQVADIFKFIFSLTTAKLQRFSFLQKQILNFISKFNRILKKTRSPTEFGLSVRNLITNDRYVGISVEPLSLMIANYVEIRLLCLSIRFMLMSTKRFVRLGERMNTQNSRVTRLMKAGCGLIFKW